MITSEDIAQKVYQMLTAAKTAGTLVISGVIGYKRSDYTKEDVIIIPRDMEGEASLRYGQINVNIHVPDKRGVQNGTPVSEIDLSRLTTIRSQVVNILKDHVESGTGWNWYISRFGSAIAEPELNEHFFSLALSLVVREHSTTTNNN